MARLRLARIAALVLIVVLGPTATAFERSEDRERCAVHDPLRRPWFGDLHVHTRYSLDASTQGTRTTPAEAYAFAVGEPLGLHPFSKRGEAQRVVQHARPLDFAAVTDHSELFGEVHLCNTPGAPGYDSTVCVIYRGWPRLAFFFMNARGAPRFSFCGKDGETCLEAARSPWQEMREAAEAAYDRSSSCRFTSFVGYEWTQVADAASNLHRNVIFRNAAVPSNPASSTEAKTPEALWDALDRDCRTGLQSCDAVVIPHNSNLSSGLMFQPLKLGTEEPFDAVYAERRRNNEPLVEIMQHKGDSECHFGAGSNDELCDHELLPYDSFMGRFAVFLRGDPAPLGFVRNALAAGLSHRAKLGVNPFEFGIIASTDTHLGAPGLVEERDYPGHGGAGIPVGEVLPDSLLDPIEYNPGGLAVAWSEENSRDALFEAFQRRETYGTSGPRISFRLFGGFELDENLCAGSGENFASQGYAQGVPMGGELSAATGGQSPLLAAWALQDPGTPEAPGVALQRLQIVKVEDIDGEMRETVIDIAGEPDNGAGVDPDTCEPHGDGAGQLCAVWRDPDFDPARHTLYYARVVQNPSCRWQAYACQEARIRCDGGGVRPGYEACCDEDYPLTVQERAWTSPIWYSPAKPIE